MTELLSSREVERIPELSRRASAYIAAIEQATPETPISLDMVVEGGDILKVLEERLAATDKLYERHEELFFPDSQLTPFDELDLEGILYLSRKVIGETKKQGEYYRNAGLGLAILQFGEAGARVARDPSLLLVPEGNYHDMAETIVTTSSKVADQAFEVFADRIAGDMNSLPQSRIGHVGCLMDRLYRFWDQQLSRDGSLVTISSELRIKAELLMPQFHFKTAIYDMHTAYGRPSPDITREGLFVRPMKQLEQTIREGTSSPWGTTTNMQDAIPFVFTALDLVDQHGYSPADCLRIVGNNIGVIAALTERKLDGLPVDGRRDNDFLVPTQSAFRLEGDQSNPRLIIDLPEEIPDESENRILKAGTCAARDPVALNPEGVTYQNIQQFSRKVYELIDANPSLVRFDQATPYVSLAALTVAYALYATAVNYYH